MRLCFLFLTDFDQTPRATYGRGGGCHDGDGCGSCKSFDRIRISLQDVVILDVWYRCGYACWERRMITCIAAHWGDARVTRIHVWRGSFVTGWDSMWEYVLYVLVTCTGRLRVPSIIYVVWEIFIIYHLFIEEAFLDPSVFIWSEIYNKLTVVKALHLKRKSLAKWCQWRFSDMDIWVSICLL